MPNTAFTVSAGATLGGIGTVGATTINGTLAPGNSVGTITVSGTLVFAPGATYLVEVVGTSADRTNVSGQATLAGTVQAVLQPGSALTRSYTILSAAGLNGSFDAVTGSVPGFATTLSYPGNDVVLNLTAQLGAHPTDNLNRNQRNAATALNGFFNGGGTLPPAFVGVFGLSGPTLGTALSQLSGEAATGAQQAAFQSMQSFLTLMLDPSVPTRGGGPGGPALAFSDPGATGSLPPEAARAYAKAMPVKALPQNFEQRWRAWGAAFGGGARIDGDAPVGSHDTTTNVVGVAAGADYRLSPDTVLGFALAGGHTRWSLSDGMGGGQSDFFQAGAFASHHNGPAYVSAALAYAWHGASASRTITVPGLATLDADFHPQVFGGRVETGYRFAAAGFGVTPYAAGQVQAFHVSGTSETATAGAFALGYGGQTTTASRSELGLWADLHLAGAFAASPATLRARVAWAHDFNTDRRLTATFQALPGASFVVDGAAPAADVALVSAVAEIALSHGWSLTARFDGELGAGTRSYAGTGALRARW
jgi:uncharacterized protein with beta-barrel porin domain